MKLSVITVNRNNKEGLQRTVESVVAQTYQGFEYIIIDGASTDGSLDIIKKHEDNITTWISEKDTGIYNAMNKGLRMAGGDYIMYLNSGDSLFENTTLEKFVPHFDGTDIIYGDFILAYPENKNVLFRNDKDITMITFLDRERHLCHQSLFMTRTSIDKAGGFDESLRIVADWKLFARAIFIQQARMKYVNETVSFFETGGISLQPGSLDAIQKEKEKVLQEDFPLIYKDFARLREMGTTFSELFNSSYFKAAMKIRKKMIRFIR